MPWVEQMAPYAPPEDLEIVAARAGRSADELIKLDANENPYGPSPRVREALAAFDGFHIYPDPDQRGLRSAIADYVGADADQVLVGNGSDELIDLLCRVYLAPGDEAVDCTPTFGMYRFSTELAGGQAVEAPRDGEWRVDVDAVRESLTERTRLIFVASPNNPSGNTLDEGSLDALLETGRLVVVDEAYVEFAGNGSYAGQVGSRDNLIVLRTFSKWAGLAGLRIGYGVLPGHVARHLWKVKPPFNVNRAAEVAVQATIDDIENVRSNIDRIVAERHRMAEALCRLPGLRVWPSRSNFILLQVTAGRAADLKDHFHRNGIAVRAYSHPRLEDAIRISVGQPADTDAVIEVLDAWLEGQEGR